MSLLISFSLLTSCGYQWGRELSERGYPTVCVPFVEGDEEGFLTNEIIYALASSGLVEVSQNHADYHLRVSLVGADTEKIGFRIVPQEVDGELRKNLRPSEGRKILKVQASLYSSDELILGPYLITASSDYDYVDGDSFTDLTFVNSSGATVVVLPFSLGQLEPIDSAETAALRPVYRQIAKKIVDALSSEW